MILALPGVATLTLSASKGGRPSSKNGTATLALPAAATLALPGAATLMPPGAAAGVTEEIYNGLYRNTF